MTKTQWYKVEIVSRGRIWSIEESMPYADDTDRHVVPYVVYRRLSPGMVQWVRNQPQGIVYLKDLVNRKFRYYA